MIIIICIIIPYASDPITTSKTLDIQYRMGKMHTMYEKLVL